LRARNGSHFVADSRVGTGFGGHACALAGEHWLWPGNCGAADRRCSACHFLAITRRSEEKIVVWDACLSFLSIFMQVERHKEIFVRYQDLGGEWQEFRASEERDLSELLQHEIDHLDGVLAIDRITDMRTMCTREEFEKRYRAHSPYATQSKVASKGD
jgi:Polypeptide deformylase